MSARPIIFHIDVNSAFLSWSAAYRCHVLGEEPDLRTVPSIVGGDQEARHGIVLAKSTPAKKYGIQTGEPIVAARKKCPNLIIIPPDFHLYVENSKALISLLKSYSDHVVQYSIDEAWADFTGYEMLYGDPVEFAWKLKDQIREELGFTVNIGVSSNRLLAKMAGDFKKPDLVHTLFPEEIEEKMWPLPVERLFLVGKAAADRLHSLGIYTIGDLAEMDHDYVNQLLGKNGLMLWSYANGLDDSPVMEKDFVSPMKSVGHGITCTADLKTEEEVWKVILELCQDIGHRLRIHGLKAQGIQIAIRSQELFTRQYQGQLSLPTIVPLEIAKLARELFQRNYDWKEPVRSVTVRAINLVSAKEPEQICLFSDPIRLEKEEKLFLAIEEIRRRFGKRAIYPAALMKDLKMSEYRDHGLIMPGVMNR